MSLVLCLNTFNRLRLGKQWTVANPAETRMQWSRIDPTLRGDLIQYKFKHTRTYTQTDTHTRKSGSSVHPRTLFARQEYPKHVLHQTWIEMFHLLPWSQPTICHCGVTRWVWFRHSIHVKKQDQTRNALDCWFSEVKSTMHDRKRNKKNQVGYRNVKCANRFFACAQTIGVENALSMITLVVAVGTSQQTEITSKKILRKIE